MLKLAETARLTWESDPFGSLEGLKRVALLINKYFDHSLRFKNKESYSQWYFKAVVITCRNTDWWTEPQDDGESSAVASVRRYLTEVEQHWSLNDEPLTKLPEQLRELTMRCGYEAEPERITVSDLFVQALFSALEKEIIDIKDYAYVKRMTDNMEHEELIHNPFCEEESDKLPEHFDLQAPEELLTEVFNCLKTERWLPDDPRKEDFIYCLTGKWTGNGKPMPKKLLFSSLDKGKYMVKYLIFGGNTVYKADWDKAERIFKVKKGDIKRLKLAKNPSGCHKIDKLFQKLYPDIKF